MFYHRGNDYNIVLLLIGESAFVISQYYSTWWDAHVTCDGHLIILTRDCSLHKYIYMIKGNATN